MPRTIMRVSLGLVFAVAVACSSPATEKSTGSNWIACSSDADCSAVPDATCGGEHVCVDRSGAKIAKSVLDGSIGTGGAPADSGMPSSGGAGGQSSITGGAGGQGPMGDGGLDAAAGGFAGQGAIGGAAGTPPTAVVDCYSPGQNLDHAYDLGVVGCRCTVGTPGFCKSGVALVCTDGRWQAVEDGPCMGCWGPDDPDLAADNPSNGCPCTNENETACMATFASGYMEAKCQGGKWTMTPTTTCGCTSDARCGLGGKCVNNICTPPRCEVDGVRYAAGVGGIAHPLDCNTCTCGSDGSLACTRLPCPTPSTCPGGYGFGSVCAECGPAGGCSLTRTGCIPQCQTSADCTSSGGYCFPNTQLCGVGGCD